MALVSEDHADDQVLQSLPFQDSIPLLRINNISLIISSNLLIRNAVNHAWESHAIKPDEMTSEMKAKIKENIYTL